MARPLLIDISGGYYHVVAREAGLGHDRSVGLVLKNFERRLSEDPKIRRAADQAVKLMTCEM